MATFTSHDREEACVAGPPTALLGGEVFAPELARLSHDVDAMLAFTADDVPIPTSSARDGMFGDRHLEYWLSGWQDAKAAGSALMADRPEGRVLDFGGGSGRLVRHLVRDFPRARLSLCDLNPAHVHWVNATLRGRVLAFANTAAPSLPYADGSLDGVLAVSVFSEIFDEEVGWLLELRRVLAPGGAVYATVLDETAWKALPEHWAVRDLLTDPEARAAYDRIGQALTIPVMLQHGSNRTVFRPRAYLQEVWTSIFGSLEVVKGGHGEQTALLLRP